MGSVSSLFGVATPAAGQAPEDRGRGVVMSGLKRSPKDGACRGRFELAHRDRVGGTTTTLCTHGPDPAPEGVDVRRRRPPEPRVAGENAAPGTQAATTSGSIPCYGTGQDGYRVQVVYARSSNVVDRYVEFAPSIVQWTAAVDAVVSASANETGGVRHVRFVTDAACNLVIDRVTLSPTGDDDFSNTIAELRSLGYNRTDRKYLVYADANVYCGIAQVYLDDSPNPAPGANASNGHPQVPGTVARVDNGCWGLTDSVEAHELMHNLGGVQESAPRATPYNHCTDENDRMCYADGSGAPLTSVCPPTQENRFDCNHDDYFSTSPPLLSYLATHWNTADSAFLARTAPSIPAGGRYNPLTPARILDTRFGNGAPAAAVARNSTLDLQVAGRGGVPSSGVSAVVMNVTVTEPTEAGYLTAFPAGEPRPLASNLNFSIGQTRPNLVVVKLGTGGKVSLYNPAGALHLVADVAGWYDTGTATTGGLYNPLTPARVLDTRFGTGAPAATLPANSALDLQVSGRGGVPTSGVSAVVLNVTAVEPSATGYVTAYPTGEARPLASNLNFVPGQTVPNLVVVKLGAGGRASLYNATGTVHLVADVAGWYGTGTATSGARYNPVTPSRILDTRAGDGAPAGPLGAGRTLDLQVAGRGGVPSTGVSAVVLNVTVTEPSTIGFVTAFPTGEARPLASNLNFNPGQTVPNLVVVKVGADGKASLYNAAGSVHLIADVAGWYAGG